jgi:hypothetical protein
MSLAQRVLAATFATAMAVTPSLAQDAKVALKPASVTTTQQDNNPTLLRQAGDYSENHPVIVIAIAKGQKDPITGEKIGDTISDVMQKIHGVPSKYFVAPGGDYTAIAFFVKGHAYGPYGLKESLGEMALAVSAYNERVLHAGAAGSSFAAKPEPQQ